MLSGLLVEGCKERCPRCGRLANNIDGVYDIIGDAVHIITTDKRRVRETSQLYDTLREAFERKISPEQAARQVEKIAPDVAAQLNKIEGKYALYIKLVILYLFLKTSISLNAGMNVDITLDVNQALEQVIEAVDHSND